MTDSESTSALVPTDTPKWFRPAEPCRYEIAYQELLAEWEEAEKSGLLPPSERFWRFEHGVFRIVLLFNVDPDSLAPVPPLVQEFRTAIRESPLGQYAQGVVEIWERDWQAVRYWYGRLEGQKPKNLNEVKDYLAARHGYIPAQLQDKTMGDLADLLRQDADRRQAEAPAANAAKSGRNGTEGDRTSSVMPAMMSAPDLARQFALPVSRVESALRRFRADCHDCVIDLGEVDNRHTNEPRYLYRTARVLTVLQGLLANR